jgi:hypothetical protein
MVSGLHVHQQEYQLQNLLEPFMNRIHNDNGGSGDSNDKELYASACILKILLLHSLHSKHIIHILFINFMY